MHTLQPRVNLIVDLSQIDNVKYLLEGLQCTLLPVCRHQDVIDRGFVNLQEVKAFEGEEDEGNSDLGDAFSECESEMNSDQSYTPAAEQVSSVQIVQHTCTCQ